MKCVCYGLLTVIIVDLYQIKLVKVLEIVEEEFHDLATHLSRHRIKGFVITCFKYNRSIAHRQMPEEDAKSRE